MIVLPQRGRTGPAVSLFPVAGTRSPLHVANACSSCRPVTHGSLPTGLPDHPARGPSQHLSSLPVSRPSLWDQGLRKAGIKGVLSPLSFHKTMDTECAQ